MLTQEFLQALDNTPGAKIIKKQIELDIVRYQKAEQFGAQAIRTGVFYLPEINSPHAKYYKTGRYGYGGGERIQGRTCFKNPLIIKAATGGKAVEKAYDLINGKNAYENMRRDVLNVIAIRCKNIVSAIAELLEKYNSTSYLAWEIYTNSKEGNCLAYAIQEHICAHAIRKAGYDGVISHSIANFQPRLSEVFDVRAFEYPWEHSDFTYDDFYNEYKIKVKRA